MKASFKSTVNKIDENNDENITLKNGWIDNDYNGGVGLTSKILNARYEIIKMIDRGTFSQVYEANDLYSTNSHHTAVRRHVVIKVLRRGCHAMGIKEYILLQHFSSLNNYTHSNPSDIVLQNGNIQNKFCK
jgi:hypothetical protein